MVTCVVLIESVDSLNVSLFRDNRLLVNYIGDLPISHFVNNKIDCLKVMFKPALHVVVPDNAYKLDTVSVNGTIKDCLISCDDFNNLSSLCGKVKDIQIYNYLDVYKSLFKDRDRVVIVDSWSKSLASVTYIEFGSIVDLRRVKYSDLAKVIHKICESYNCYEVVNAKKTFDYVGLNSVVSNLDQIEKDRLSSLRHIQLCFESEGLSVLEKEEILDWSTDKDGKGTSLGGLNEELDSEDVVDSREDYYTRNLNGKDFNVESDYQEEEFEEVFEEPRKVGFFEKLFGKKKQNSFNKPKRKKPRPSKSNAEDIEEDLAGDDDENLVKVSRSKNKSKGKKVVKQKSVEIDTDYSRFEEGYEDDSDLNDYRSRFSQVAVGNLTTSPRANGRRNNAGKFNIYDTITYVSAVVFLVISITCGSLHFIWRDDVIVLNDNIVVGNKLKNQITTNLDISKNSANSPAMRVSQLRSLALPKSYKILSVDYNGIEYKLSLSVDSSDNIDEFSSYLPNVFKLGKIEPRKSNNNSKIYDIVLAVS